MSGRAFPLSSPVRISRPSQELMVMSPSTSAAVTNTLKGDGSLGTLFTLISIEDPTVAISSGANLSGAGATRRVVTAASFAQFLGTMRVNVDFDTVSDLIVATARVAGALPLASGVSADSGRNGSPSRSDEISLNEVQAYAMLEAMPNTVSILLDRCELLGEMSEHPFAVARTEEAIVMKEQIVAAMEADKARLSREVDAVLKKTEALGRVTSSFGADDERADRYGSPTLRSAEVEQRQRLATLQASARKATDTIEALTNKLQSAIEVHAVRERDAEEADAELRGSEKRLATHTMAMLEIEQQYMAAKARFDQSKELQRELNRQKEANQEAFAKARALLIDAQDLASALEREIVTAKSDLEGNLSVEIKETQQIVQNLEAATTIPNRKDRQLMALRDEHKALEREFESMDERIAIVKNELMSLSVDRQEQDRMTSRHDQWVMGTAADAFSKAYEDSLLMGELRRAVERAQHEVEARRFEERRSAAYEQLYGGPSGLNSSSNGTQQQLQQVYSQYQRLRSPNAIHPF